jgi:hypothetical protein
MRGGSEDPRQCEIGENIMHPLNLPVLPDDELIREFRFLELMSRDDHPNETHPGLLRLNKAATDKARGDLEEVREELANRGIELDPRDD